MIGPFCLICDFHHVGECQTANAPVLAELARLRRELAERDERISEAVKAWRMGKISALKLADRLEGKK